ncbi:hypothetical protein DFH28DRAFT_1119236 [Melampsora americana]|nr:hypothetical protein DFH28DRAFT_1119236 [Melampsora americana]
MDPNVLFDSNNEDEAEDIIERAINEHVKLNKDTIESNEEEFKSKAGEKVFRLPLDRGSFKTFIDHGTTLVAEGSPLFPDQGTLYVKMLKQKVTNWGTMPKSSRRSDILAYLKVFFGLQVASLENHTNYSLANHSDFTVIMAAVIILDQLDSHEDTFNDDLLKLSSHLFLSSMAASDSLRSSCKRRRLEDKTMVAILVYGIDCVHSKRESDCTWGIVAQMSKESFMALLHEISGNPVFHNNSSCPQALVQWQLLVALASFGLSGNGGQGPLIAKLFTMAARCVDNYTNHCIWALVQLEEKYIKWPTSEERKKIKDEIEEPGGLLLLKVFLRAEFPNHM